MNDRRNFIKTCAASLAAVPIIAHATGTNKPTATKPLPPGAISLARFKSKCTACHLCVSHCPSQVIVPSTHENGLTGMMTPVLAYDVHKFCEFECTACMDVCPNDALVQMPLEEKKLIQIGIVRLNIHKCVVIMHDEDCGACAEHCPTGALQMVNYKDGLTKPKVVSEDRCIGCGGCESICPEMKRAIFIERLDVHAQALPPTVEEQEEVEIDGFGF